MNTKNPGQALLEKKVDKLGLRREVEDEIAQISNEDNALTKRYILTGTPGCGKTSIIRALEVAGYPVIEEVASDIIALRQAQGVAEPWTRASFIDDVTNLQMQRQMRVAELSSRVQFYDRSPLCTYALSVWLGFPVSTTLTNEMERIREAQIYQRQVFFVENLGFCEPSAARKISFEESLAFEKVHEETYRAFGYECIRVPSQDLSRRVEQIRRHVSAAG
jgi:predicted ATPase